MTIHEGWEVAHSGQASEYWTYFPRPTPNAFNYAAFFSVRERTYHLYGGEELTDIFGDGYFPTEVDTLEEMKAYTVAMWRMS